MKPDFELLAVKIIQRCPGHTSRITSKQRMTTCKEIEMIHIRYLSKQLQKLWREWSKKNLCPATTR